MVEAAFVLPLLILMAASLMLFGLFYYESHCRQIACHQNLLESLEEDETMFLVKSENVTTKQQISGLANLVVKKEQTYRIYKLRPAQWICLGEMIDIDEE